MTVKFYSEHTEPTRGTNESAGFDLIASLHYTTDAYDEENNPCKLFLHNERNMTLSIPPYHRVMVPTGLYTAPETDLRMFFAVVLRSSIGWKKGLMIPNAIGVIDQDYRGEWKILLYNPSKVSVLIEHKERVAQLIPLKTVGVSFERVQSIDELPHTERGKGGFGSTKF